MATVEFRYDPKNTAWFTANAAMVLKAGEPAYHDTTGLFKLGDGVTALSALSFLPTGSASTPTIQQVLTAGQVATTTIETTGFIKTGGLSTQFLKADGSVDSTVYGVGNALTTNPLSQFAATTSLELAGVISDETGSGALVFGTSPTFTTDITTPKINGTSGTLQIGTTDLVNIGNKTTTSQRLVRIGQDTAWIDIGSQSGSTARGAIYINQATPDTTNYALSAHQTTGTTYLNGKNATQILVNGGIVTTYATNQVLFAVNAAGGSTINYQFTVPNNTALTSSTEVPIFKIIGGNNTWPTGAITNQKWSWITANTANFSAASIITNSYGLFVEAATAGTFATITNNFALGLAGSLKINDTFNIVFDTTTGTKIATATTQKLSFWNATPIVQPLAVTTVQGLYNALSSTGLIASGTITLPTGYGRSINNIAINTTGAAVANTDYYYFCTATLTFTLPTAVGNTNTYYIKVTSGTLTIDTTSSQTIDSSLTIVTSVANTAFTLISDGTNWQII